MKVLLSCLLLISTGLAVSACRETPAERYASGYVDYLRLDVVAAENPVGLKLFDASRRELEQCFLKASRQFEDAEFGALALFKKTVERRTFGDHGRGDALREQALLAFRDKVKRLPADDFQRQLNSSQAALYGCTSPVFTAMEKAYLTEQSLNQNP